MEDNPGFRLLRDAFAKFAQKYDGGDMARRALRAVATGGKAAVDRGLQEFPKTFVAQAAQDIYGLIASQDVADGVSTIAQSFDEEKVKEMMDGLVAKMKDPEVARQIAEKVKGLLEKTSVDELELQIDGLLSDRSLNERMIFTALFGQIKPLLDEMKNSSVEEVAEKIIALADNVPGDVIAAQIGAVTRDITPERVSQQAHDIVGQLPSPQAVSDIVHGLGGIASQKLDALTKISGPGEAGNIIGDFAENARDLVNDTLAQDKAAKKVFKPKGGQDFEL